MKTVELKGTILALTEQLEMRKVELQNAARARQKTGALRNLKVPLNDKGTLMTQRDDWAEEEVQARAGWLLGLLAPVMLEAPGEDACAPTGAQRMPTMRTSEMVPMAASMAWPLLMSLPTAAGPPPPAGSQLRLMSDTATPISAAITAGSGQASAPGSS